MKRRRRKGRWIPRILRALAIGAATAVPGLNLVPVGYSIRLMAHASRGEARPATGLGAMLADAKLGLGVTAATLAWLAVPGLFLYLGWYLGWTISFEYVDTWEPALERVGHGMSVVGALLLTPLMAYLPAAQVHAGRTGRARALFEIGAVLDVVRRAPWAWWRASLLIPLFAVPHLVLRTIAAATQPDDHPAAVRVVANLLVIGPFLLARWQWGRTWAKHAERERAAPSRKAALGLAVAYFVSAAGTTLIIAASVFLAAHGAWDFFFPPLLTVPTVPYPGGLWVPAFHT